MALIKDEEINAIREQADIVDIISDYLKLTKKGKNYVAVCPFHDDHSPSLVVSKERQIFNCFTCRTGGNVFSFIMKYENVDFFEALQIVANKIGYKLSSTNFNNFESKNKKEYEIMEIAKKYYLNNIFTDLGTSARKYLENRGINNDIIREFNLGLALKSKNELYKLLVKKNINNEMLDNLGLVYINGTDVFDFFNNRIIIPIEDLKGNVVGFSGRIFNGEKETSKYINTKETVIFKKGQILFNYHNAKNAIRDEKCVIVVEGNMDAITLSSSGIKNVVALMGVALSKEQIDVLKKLKVPVILMLDNDQAGLNSTLKNGEMLKNADIDVKVVRLTGEKDPDEYIRANGVDALKDNIKHAINFVDFKLEYLKNDKNLNNIDDLVTYVKEVVKALKNENDLTKEIFISKISKDYQIDPEILKREININNEQIKKEEKVVYERKKKANKYEIATSKVLYHMMVDSKYIVIYKRRLGYFKEKEKRMLASEIVYYNSEHNNINIADFTTYIMPQENLFNLVNEIVNENIHTIINEDEFNACIDVILKSIKIDEIKELKEEIKKEMDISKKIDLITKLTNLKKEV